MSYFSTQWFITMFTYDLELSLVNFLFDVINFQKLMKIWNLFLLKGWKIIIRVALSLLWHFKSNSVTKNYFLKLLDEIFTKSIDDLPYFLKTFLKDNNSNISEVTNLTYKFMFI